MKGKSFLDFTSITERNKENSFLDVDWMIKMLLAHGGAKPEKLSNASTPTAASSPIAER